MSFSVIKAYTQSGKELYFSEERRSFEDIDIIDAFKFDSKKYKGIDDNMSFIKEIYRSIDSYNSMDGKYNKDNISSVRVMNVEVYEKDSTKIFPYPWKY